MPDLGSYGEAVSTEPDTFTYFGVVLTVNPEFGPLDLGDWMEYAQGLDDQSREGREAVKVLARSAFGESYDEFWATAKKNRQSVDDVFDAVLNLAGAIAHRPTKRSSDSSAGPQRTKAKSEPDSLSGLPTKARRQVQKYEKAGRPDLALMVLDAAEARAS